MVGVGEHLAAGGLDNLLPKPNGKPFIYKKLHDILSRKFRADALSTISGPEHKLRTYALVKTEAGLEDYLESVRNVSVRTQFTKFRISDHNLEIEKGRHRGLSADQRFCPFCEYEVENEIHFLLECPIYKGLREADKVFRLDEQNMSEKEKFIFLVSKGEEIAPSLYKMFELRNFLLSLPKRTD